MTSCGCETHRERHLTGADNVAGQTALAYRTGTHGSLLDAMRKAIGAHAALGGFSTRDADDPTIALLDGWASVADVLSFYNERIANEGFLRTALERRSVFELARAIGYELGPGVAAATVLAFTIETAPTSPPVVQLAAGTQAQSVPAQDMLPAIFETVEAIEARPAWNVLRPALTEAWAPRFGDDTFYIEGVDSRLRPGDPVLLLGAERAGEFGREEWDFRRVEAVEEFPAAAGPDAPAIPTHTVVRVDRPVGHSYPRVRPAAAGARLYALRDRAALFGHNAQPWLDLPLPLRVGEKNPLTGANITGPYAGRQSTWADAELPADATTLRLDRAYERIAPGSWIVLANPSYAEAFHVEDVVEGVYTDFLLSGKTSLLTVSGENTHKFSPKDTVVFVESEGFDLVERPVTTPVRGAQITLDHEIDIPDGRLVVVEGTPAGTVERAAQAAVVDHTTVAGGRTVLHLQSELRHDYEPASVRIFANVAPATHGQTRNEVLGATGGESFPRAALADGPLTYVPATNADGRTSSLEVRVDGILWDEVDDFIDAPGDARIYMARRAEDGTVTIQFGDGVNGARPPSRAGAVTARYRVGTGLDGQNEAGAISLPLSMPLGLKGVVNPMPARGAENPEDVDAARTNATRDVRALGRIVSVRDVQDFARAFAGIGRALASELWNGEASVIHLTVAAADGTPVAAGSDLHQRLIAALDSARHADRPIVVDGYTDVRFEVRAGLAIDPRRELETVLAAATTALRGGFSFAARAFGQSVTRSEVLALLHRVPGVTGVVLQRLGQGAGVADVVARLARLEDGGLEPADLVTIDPAGIRLEEHRS